MQKNTGTGQAMENSERLLLDAVRNSSATSKKGILQKLFSVWFDAFVYNQIWEDPRVDLKALKLDENSRVLTISSGGCNALNYLLESPGSVTAVDLNRHHIFLLRLKIAAAKHLPGYKEFFAFFGFGKDPDNVTNYEKYVAPHLDEETRKFWEASALVPTRRRIDYFRKGGIYDHSRNGYFLRFFHTFSRLIGCRPEKLLAAETKEEQEELFEEYISPFFDSVLIKAAGKLPVTMFGLGIPPQQYDELKKDVEGTEGLIDVYRARARKLAAGFPIDDNYFAWQAFARKYDTEKRIALPEYLKEENFPTLRDNIGKLSAKIGSVTTEIAASPEGSYNRFVFLDAQDWMDADAMTQLWGMIAERSEPGARIIFRTAGERSPIEEALPAELAGRFTYHEEESRALFEEDRASIYGGFHLYTLND